MKYHFNREALSRLSQFQLEWLLRCYISELGIPNNQNRLPAQIELVRTALKLKY